jgi:hypothetical protein
MTWADASFEIGASFAQPRSSDRPDREKREKQSQIVKRLNILAAKGLSRKKWRLGREKQSQFRPGSNPAFFG